MSDNNTFKCGCVSCLEKPKRCCLCGTVEEVMHISEVTREVQFTLQCKCGRGCTGVVRPATVARWNEQADNRGIAMESKKWMKEQPE